MRSILIGFMLIVFTGCSSAEDISGIWYIIDSEETYDKTQYIEIFQDDTAYLTYSEFEAKGNIEIDEYGWIFHSNIGDYNLAIARSSNELRNGSLAVDLANEFEDILIGFFVRIEEE